MFNVIKDNFSNLKLFSFPFIERMNNRYIFNTDGSIGIAFKLGGIARSGLSHSDYSRIISENLNTIVLNETSGDINFQSIQLRRKFVNFPVVSDKAPIYIQERNKNALKFVRDNKIFKDHLYFTVTVFPSQEDEEMFTVLKKMALSIKDIFGQRDISKINEKFDPEITLERISRLETTARRIESIFFAANCKIERLNKLSDLEYMFHLMVRNSSNLKKREEAELVRELEENNANLASEIMQGVEVDYLRRFFIMDEVLHRSYFLDKVDTDFDLQLNASEVLSNAPFEFNYIVNLKPLKQDEVKDLLRKRIKEARKSNSMVNTKVTDPSKIDDELVKTLDESLEDKKQFVQEKGGVRANIQFTYRESIHTVEQKVHEDGGNILGYVLDIDNQLSMSIFNQIQRSKWKPLASPFFNFIRSMPCQVDLKSLFLESHLEFPTPVSCILPVFADTRSDMDFDGFNHVFSDNATVFPIDHLDPRRDSHVSTIVGKMGSGKSVLMGHKLSEIENNAYKLGQTALWRVIDWAGTQGSFKKRVMLKNAKGELPVIYRFGTGNLPKLNIFDLEENGMKPTPEKINDTYLSLYAQKIITEEDPAKGKELVKKVFDLFLDIAIDEFNTHEKIKRRKSEIIAENLLISREQAISIFERDFSLKVGNCEPNNVKMNVIKKFIDIVFARDINMVTENRYADTLESYVRELYRNNDESRFPFLKARLIYILKNILNGNSDVVEKEFVFEEMISSLDENSELSKQINEYLEIFDRKTALSLAKKKTMSTVMKGKREVHYSNLDFLKMCIETNVFKMNERLLEEFREAVHNDKLTLDFISKIEALEFSRTVPLMSDLKDFVFYLNSDEEGNMDSDSLEIVNRLGVYCKGGTYDMFDYQTELSFEHDGIIFDLQGLANDQRLATIYSLIIFNQLKDEMYKKLDRVKGIAIDEASFSLKNEIALEMIAEFMKTSRKYAFSLLMASQSFEHFCIPDFPDIINLTTEFIFCSVSEPEKELIKSNLGISDNELKILMRSGKVDSPNGYVKVYSTYATVTHLKSDKKEVRRVCNYLSPFEANLYSSSQAENDVIGFFVYNKGMDIEEAIFKLIRKEVDEYENEMIKYLRNKGNTAGIKYFQKHLREQRAS